MDKIKDAMNKLAMRKGGQPYPITIDKNVSSVLYLIDGFHGAAQVHLVTEKNGTNYTVAILSRLVMLDFNPIPTQDINLKLSQSWMSWSMIDPKANLQLRDPTVLWVPIRANNQNYLVESFSTAESLLDFFAYKNPTSFIASASFTNCNRLYRTACGVHISIAGIELINPPSRMVPPGSVKTVGFDVTPFLTTNETVGAFWKATYWKRQAKLATTLLDKFIYLWLSMESSLPRKKEYHTGKAISRNISMLWGDLPQSILQGLDPKYSSVIRNQQTEITKLKDFVYRTYQRFRGRILHCGEIDLETNPTDVEEIVDAIEAFHIITSRCCHLLDFSIVDRGKSDLRAVWDSSNVTDFVCKGADSSPDFLTLMPLKPQNVPPSPDPFMLI